MVVIHRDAAHEGQYNCTFSDEMVLWTVNGGYIAAAALAAALEELDLESVIALKIDIDFLRPCNVGNAHLRTKTWVDSGSARMTEVQVDQAEKTRAIARVWATSSADGPILEEYRMPLVPSPDELQTLEDVLKPDEPRPHVFWSVFEQKPIARNVDRIAPSARILRWFKFRNDRGTTEPRQSLAGLLPLIDTFGVPAANQVYKGNFLSKPAPTVHLSASFLQPAELTDWFLLDACCPFAKGGLIHTTARVWSSRGSLVALGSTDMVRK